jgi:D-cysteine desulfhydrase
VERKVTPESKPLLVERKPTSESRYPLFEEFPELEETIPTLGLGIYPSPVQPMPNVAKALGQGYTDKVWVKRDDLNNEAYGGNKVRKFELEYAPLEDQGYDTVATMGGTGTNQGVAAAIFCKQLGFKCEVVVYPQPITEDVRNKLMLFHTTGCRIHKTGGVIRAIRRLGRICRPDNVYWHAPGGTSPIGNAAFVNAAFELARQVDEGEMPRPDYIYVAAGTTGTFAGLLYGAHLAGLTQKGTKVVGVRVVPWLVANGWVVRWQMRRTYAFLCSRSKQFEREVPKRFPKVTIENGFVGKGYGHATDSGVEAFSLAAEDDLELDLTYTGKTLAAMLDRLRKEPHSSALFWVTNHTGDLSPHWRDADHRDLPKELHDVFEGELEYSWSELLGRPW